MSAPDNDAGDDQLQAVGEALAAIYAILATLEGKTALHPPSGTWGPQLAVLKRAADRLSADL